MFSSSGSCCSVIRSVCWDSISWSLTTFVFQLVSWNAKAQVCGIIKKVIKVRFELLFTWKLWNWMVLGCTSCAAWQLILISTEDDFLEISSSGLIFLALASCSCHTVTTCFMNGILSKDCIFNSKPSRLLTHHEIWYIVAARLFHTRNNNIMDMITICSYTVYVHTKIDLVDKC